MRKILSLAMLLAAALLAAPVAHAEVVLGASTGQSDLMIGSVQEDDTGGQLYGGFRFLKFVGVELEYTDFGTFEHSSGGTTDTLDVNRADVFAVGVIPFGRFEVYGKLGYGYWDGELRSAGGNPVKDDGSDPSYGAGFAIKFIDLLAIRFEYEVFDIDGVDDLTMASIGLDFRF